MHDLDGYGQRHGRRAEFIRDPDAFRVREPGIGTLYSIEGWWSSA